MSGEHYVYLHRRSSDGSVFYVGKGLGRRAWAQSGRNRRWKFVAKKHGREVQIVRGGLAETCAFTLERIGIATLGPAGLVNLTDGGGGIAGWRHSAEARARIGAFHRGRPKDPASIAKTAAAHRGKTLPAAHREKLSAAKKGKPRGALAEAVRRKIGASHLGLTHSDESKAKMRASHPRRSGKDSPSYDHKVRVFEHPDHGKFTGTRGDFIAAYRLPAACVSSVITGKQKTVRGWRATDD